MQEFKQYRNTLLSAQKQGLLTPQSVPTVGGQKMPQNHTSPTTYFNQELYNNICREIMKMKESFDKVQNAEHSLRNIALENSSLDNLIQASLNPQIVGRNRVDSLCNIRQKTGRKRAMTIDGPVRNKYVRLNHTQNSAFVSFKNAFKAQEAIQETKDGEEEDSKDAEMKIEEPKLDKKSTQVVKEKGAPSSSHQPLLSQGEAFPQRKRARSF